MKQNSFLTAINGEISERRHLLEQLVAVEDANYGNSPLRYPADELETIMGPDYLCLCAYEKDAAGGLLAVVGYCTGAALERFADRPGVKQTLKQAIINGEKTVYLASLGVLPKMQRQDIGTRLLRRFVEETVAHAGLHPGSGSTTREHISCNLFKKLFGDRILSEE